MADLSYHHGSKVEESPDLPSVLRLKRYGVTFFNGTAPDADPAQFPLGLSLVNSLPQAKALGAAGTLLEDLTSHFNEGGSYAIINRVAHSDNPATLKASLIGDPVARTGLYAALKAKAKFALQPKVLCTAGETGDWIEGGVVSVTLTNGGALYTSPPAVAFAGDGEAAAVATIHKHKVKSLTITNAGGDYATAPAITIAPPPEGGTQATATATVAGGLITAITINNAGTGYVDAPAVSVSGGGGAGAILTAVLGGPVTLITVTDPGEGYEAAPVITLTGGGGTGALAIANIGDVGNGYVSALKAICPQIRARAYIHGPNTTDAEAVRFRSTLGDRILAIDPKGIKNVNGVPVVVPSAPVFAGIRSRVVGSAEGVSGSVSNKPILTLDGAARTIQYPTDSNYLNENCIATIINEGGLRTWGSRLAASEPLWQFDSVRAVADMVNDELEMLYFQWVDKKFTKANLKMMVSDGNAAMRVFALNEDIIGGRVWLSDLNVPSLNAQGKVFLSCEFEPVVPMEQIHITTHRNIIYFQLLLDQVRQSVESGPLSLAA